MRHGPMAPTREDDGLTLVEVIASVVILALIMVPMLSLFKQLVVQSRLNAQQQMATLLAREALANAVVLGTGSMNDTSQTTVTLNSVGGAFDTTFTIKTSVTTATNWAWPGILEDLNNLSGTYTYSSSDISSLLLSDPAGNYAYVGVNVAWNTVSPSGPARRTVSVSQLVPR
jgi:prepilin-type N-terminal cleavage/methylation domain-containing protein